MKLYQCPKCKKQSHLIVDGDWMAGYQVRCECGISGPNELDAESAAHAWNAMFECEVAFARQVKLYHG